MPIKDLFYMLGGFHDSFFDNIEVSFEQKTVKIDVEDLFIYHDSFSTGEKEFPGDVVILFKKVSSLKIDVDCEFDNVSMWVFKANAHVDSENKTHVSIVSTSGGKISIVFKEFEMSGISDKEIFNIIKSIGINCKV